MLAVVKITRKGQVTIPKEVAVDKLKGFLQYKGIINEDKKNLLKQ